MTHFKKILYAMIASAFFIASAYADIPIHIMPNTGLGQSTTSLNQTTIKIITTQALAHAHINVGNNSPYASIAVKFIQTKSQRYLLAHLMSRYFLSYQIVRVNLNPNNTIHYPVIKNYRLQPADFAAESVGTTPQCPAQYQTGKPLFVIATPAYSPTNGYMSVTRSVDALSNAILKTHQYQLVKLLDSNATVKNYQNVLACPNLKYFFHIGGSDDYGQFFYLIDGDFNATYFSQNPQLNFSNAAISLDSCQLYDQVNQGFCPIIHKMKNAPMAYISGKSQLLIYGSPETYTCFWEKVLKGAPMTQSTLHQCAIEHDPSVRHSRSGTYFIGSSHPHTQILIRTNQRTITIKPNDYAILKLHHGEMVTQYAMKNSKQTIVCSPDPTNRATLLNNPGLTSGEFGREYQGGNTCEFAEISRMERNGNITRDIYGFDPKQSCFKTPNKPPVGTLTVSNISNSTESNISGFIFMNCNGVPMGYPEGYPWQTLTSQLNVATNLSCTFNLSSQNAAQPEIASMHLNIRPSTTLPGIYSGQISDVKSMNGYPLPTITYSGKGDAQGYHNGAEIVFNPK